MRCHLEDEQQVVFDEGSEETILEKARSTELTGFFDYNAKFPETDLKYVDFPKKFVWDNKEKFVDYLGYYRMTENGMRF